MRIKVTIKDIRGQTKFTTILDDKKGLIPNFIREFVHDKYKNSGGIPCTTDTYEIEELGDEH